MYTLLSRSWCMIYKEKTLIKIMISSFFFFVVAMMVQISPINYFKNNRAMSLIHSPVKSWGGCLNLYDEKVSDINAPNKLIKKEKNFEILTRVLQFQDKLMLYIYNSVHLRRHRVDLLLLQKEHLHSLSWSISDPIYVRQDMLSWIQRNLLWRAYLQLPARWNLCSPKCV